MSYMVREVISYLQGGNLATMTQTYRQQHMSLGDSLLGVFFFFFFKSSYNVLFKQLEPHGTVLRFKLPNYGKLNNTKSTAIRKLSKPQKEDKLMGKEGTHTIATNFFWKYFLGLARSA